MKGDFTRDTFDPLKHFSRVLMQQGRVTLDADNNEQAAILLRYLRTMARDIIGPYAAPVGAEGGFHLTVDPDGVLTISKGRYYVDGILVENDTDNCTYKNQPDYPLPADDPLLVAASKPGGTGDQAFIIYLDVWERHITALDDDSIREKALNGPDTCTRAKVVWQVKSLPLTKDEVVGAVGEMTKAEQKVGDELRPLLQQKAQFAKDFQNSGDPAKEFEALMNIQLLDLQIEPLMRTFLVPPSLVPPYEAVLQKLTDLSNASLAARVDPGAKIDDACITPPASKYRGAENQLYRVEIHSSGVAGEATFKWSRDNGSVATAWLGVEGSDIQVATARGFAAGNWVELSDDTNELLVQPGTLVQLDKVEGDILSVDSATTLPPFSNFPKNPKIRRWDHVATDAITLGDDNAVPIQESPPHAKPEQIVWIDLEDGVQITFSLGGEYRTGDYWLVPARVATGNVEWPQADDLNPQPLPPHGVRHHHALLGLVTIPQRGDWNVQELRYEFWPIFFWTWLPGIKPAFSTTSATTGKPQPPKPSKKPPKARKRPAKKGPALPAEGPPS